MIKYYSFIMMNDKYFTHWCNLFSLLLIIFYKFLQKFVKNFKKKWKKHKKSEKMGSDPVLGASLSIRSFGRVDFHFARATWARRSLFWRFWPLFWPLRRRSQKPLKTCHFFIKIWLFLCFFLKFLRNFYKFYEINDKKYNKILIKMNKTYNKL